MPPSRSGSGGPLRRLEPERRRIASRRARLSRSQRLRIAGIVSLLLHVLIGILLLVTIHHETQSELLPPPAPVSMVFESGQRNKPTLPVPRPNTQVSPAPPSKPTPPANPAPPATEVPRPIPPLPIPPPPVPLPPVVQPSPPVAEPPPPAAPPAEQPQPAPPVEEPLPAPPPPPPVEQPAEPAVRSPPPKPAPPNPTTNPTAQAPAKRAPAIKPPEFPQPLNYSFGSPTRQLPTRPTPHPPGTIDLSLGPAARGPANVTPHADIDGDNAGPDWRNALSQWVAQHAYYPEQARRNREDGDAKVHVVAMPDGRVTSVELIGKSGSMWLDLALQSMFRNAHIPALPSGMTEPMEFNFTMHYILRYQ